MTLDWRANVRGIFAEARSGSFTRARPFAASCARCLRPLQLGEVFGYGHGHTYCRRCAELLDAARGPGSSRPAKGGL